MSGIDHQALRLVAGIVWEVGAIPSTGGVAVYMIQYSGRGAFSPMSTRRVWCDGSLSKLRTASLAAASARSFPRMCVCALILWRVVLLPDLVLSSRRFIMPSSRVL